MLTKVRRTTGRGRGKQHGCTERRRDVKCQEKVSIKSERDTEMERSGRGHRVKGKRARVSLSGSCQSPDFRPQESWLRYGAQLGFLWCLWDPTTILSTSGEWASVATPCQSSDFNSLTAKLCLLYVTACPTPLFTIRAPLTVCPRDSWEAKGPLGRAPWISYFS